MVWGNATACCYVQMEEYLEGNTTLRLVLLKTFAQLMGGCCVYRFVQIFWWFELAHTHENRAFESCTTDLTVSKSYMHKHRLERTHTFTQNNGKLHIEIRTNAHTHTRSGIERRFPWKSVVFARLICTLCTILGECLFGRIYRRICNIAMQASVTNDSRFGNEACSIHRFVHWDWACCRG